MSGSIAASPSGIALAPPMFATERARLLGGGALAVTAACAYAAAAPALGLASAGALPLAAVFAAALAASLAGFAFSAMAGAVLFHLIDAPVAVVQILLVCSLANQAMSTWAMRRSIDWRRLLPFLAGSAVGVPLGLLALLNASSKGATMALGAGLAAYGAYALLRPAQAAAIRTARWDWLIGAAGGLTGGFAAFPGGPVAISAQRRGWDKTQQRAVAQPFIMLSQCMALGWMALAGGTGAAALDPSALASSPSPCSVPGAASRSSAASRIASSARRRTSC